MAAVGAWPVPWAPYGRRGRVVGPLGPVWPPWGVACPLGTVGLQCVRGPSSGLCRAAVGAWTVPRSFYGRGGGMAGSLGL